MSSAVSPLKSGDQAPSFTLLSDQGKELSLHQWAGQYVVLFFYPKDDTAGCTREALDFYKLRQEFEAAGAQIIGISPDSCASHENFKKKHNFDLVLLSDTNKEILNAYGVFVDKKMYGRTYKGVERTTFLIGPKGEILYIWPKVSIPEHARNVLNFLRKIQEKAA